jgi:hypothetical protein
MESDIRVRKFINASLLCILRIFDAARTLFRDVNAAFISTLFIPLTLA